MEEAIIQMTQQIDEKRYGKFRGIVIDNEDPEKRGRIRVLVPSVLADQTTDWALPCLPYGGISQQGFFMVPDIDSQVWIEFEEGDISRPIWVGTFWQQEDDTPEDAKKDSPTTRMLQTTSGHILQFDDESGAEQFRLYHPADTELTIDHEGTVLLADPTGAEVKIDAAATEITIKDSHGNSMTLDSSGTVVEDANGHKITMEAAGITAEAPKIVLKGSQVHLGDEGGEPVIKGQSFLSMFATHIHTSAPVVGGPTSPPIPQGEMSTLSTTVKAI